MSAAMDMFLATDSLSFPDTLDIDIKSDIDSLVGSHGDFSSLGFGDLQPLEFEDIHEIKWFNSSSNHSNLDFSGEDGPLMVNPNAVMPIMSLAQNVRSPSPSIKESHLTFSPATIKISSLKTEANSVKKDLSNRLENIESKKPVFKTITKVTPILAKPQVPQVKTITKSTSTSTPTLLFRNAIPKVTTPIHVTHVSSVPTVRTVAPSNFTSRKSNTQPINNGQRVFPKPAYSYSCLIAMALKNSRTGSLPVSEIYNFMCRHFPYFKTAPNGWKNSVRHNLSLNKCFEKIEKPAVNGAQRKGCLWAMNPAKISKMDEEVQKWSRKDPRAIRNAMVNPETLESLERGEMKFACVYDEEGEAENYPENYGSAESEEGTDESEAEAEQEVDQEIEIENGQYEIQIKDEELDDESGNQDYEDDDSMEDDKEMLRMEMALAHKELLEYERTINNKRRRTYYIQH